jgi:protein-S-isoprenylcysteine O-methyltransferase Ste14
MYLAMGLVVAGQVVVSRSAVLFAYLALLMTAFHLVVTRSEEPRLQRLFDGAYEAYCKTVPRWIPRRPPANSSHGERGRE